MSQRLAVLAMRMGSGVKRLNSSGLRGVYHDLVRLTEDVHALSYRLHPSALADFGAQAAIESECTHFSQTSSIDVRTDLAHVPEKLPQEVSLHLFRIVQEALRNAARHAGATRVDVSLNSAKGGLRLLISDNGNGFNPAKKQGGIGLSSMRYRARAIGGTCEILSELGGGCRIVVSVPLHISDQPSHLANFGIGADAESGKTIISRT
jgi:signal transduction histidine kinase